MLKRVVLITLALCATGCWQTSGPAVDSSKFGSFDATTVPVNLLADGRNVILAKELSFTDSHGMTWTAPPGEESDGASIPQVFWSIIGGPWEGRYRFAALIHDHYCDVHEGRTWQSVHRMFYEASLAGGTDPLLAKLMYAAVYHFGPRWADQTAGFEQMESLIIPERARIAQAVEGEQIHRMMATTAATSAVTMPSNHLPSKITPEEQGLLVVSQKSWALHAMTMSPVASPTLSKWQRICNYLNEHRYATPEEIEKIP